ncbi:uncharacterized protein LOC110843992 [Folsomia candida]|uniref:Non-histone chromosomal protein 6 n=1 Tax=Folsomia candida TaxID=158441 RepID=A0A226ENT2_FOLCA|nr:uncharacterized protein LOC110843992 [Folsomia candida]OXA58878.1 Non-histone chromosomal protein 6 [Folsomia candida]
MAYSASDSEIDIEVTEDGSEDELREESGEEKEKVVVFDHAAYQRKIREMDAYYQRMRSFGMEFNEGRQSRLGAGRGRGRPVKENSDEDDDNVCNLVEIGSNVSINRSSRASSRASIGDPLGIRPAGSETQGLNNESCKAGRVMPESSRAGREVAGSSNAKKKKMNGYLLFALSKKKEIEVQTRTKMDKTMDQVLKMFDEEWKNLSEDDKTVWKDKAKRA